MATYRTFLQKVSQARGLPVDSVDAIGGGRVWIGETAHRIGLVDVLGDLNRAIAIAAEKAGLAPGTYRIRVLPRPRTFAERLAEQLEARAVQSWRNLTASPATRMLEAYRPTLERLRLLHGTPLARMWPEVSVR